MFDTHITRRPGTITAKPKEPKEIRIALYVCGCYRHETVVFFTAKAEQVAKILGITIEDLECAVMAAMLTGKPEVVACYKQRDIAETKLALLNAKRPFIARSCYSFRLIDEC